MSRGGLRHTAERWEEIGLAARQLRTDRAYKRGADLMPAIEAIKAAGARSLAQIAAGLNERNIPTPRGCEWSAVQVQRAIRAAYWHQVELEWRAQRRAQSARR
jgi:hypothetical protein